MSKGLRKITPTAPFRPTAAAAAPSPDVHLEMAAAIARAADTVQRQLQSAFLGMYSNPESKVWCLPLNAHGMPSERQKKLLSHGRVRRILVSILRTYCLSNQVLAWCHHIIPCVRHSASL